MQLSIPLFFSFFSLTLSLIPSDEEFFSYVSFSDWRTMHTHTSLVDFGVWKRTQYHHHHHVWTA